MVSVIKLRFVYLLLWILKMVSRFNARGCTTNFSGHVLAAVFGMPKYAELINIWIKFMNHADAQSLKNVFVCEKHF